MIQGQQTAMVVAAMAAATSPFHVLARPSIPCRTGIASSRHRYSIRTCDISIGR
jgi:hypothetical protein